ncbi:hypothetical protein DCAR_0207089 [Daucus carota subsp. sativus]|uniref:Hexosyltransferase n=1 Tax=Daucus carota subsp. sativus TaxID=79200 RepID=A0AAF1AP99_DAUCS|nr:hypothetical protein DCAR_0207089 [Daucus carota subsp. sativus]
MIIHRIPRYILVTIMLMLNLHILYACGMQAGPLNCNIKNILMQKLLKLKIMMISMILCLNIPGRVNMPLEMHILMLNYSHGTIIKVSSVPNLSIIHLGLCFLYIFCSVLSALDRAKEMGHILSLAKDQLYDCIEVARTLRAMLQMKETNVLEMKKKSAFLTQLAAKTVPRPLHCLPLLLATDYLLQGYENKEFPNSENLEDNSLFHYAIFSDNVLATSIVINSTVLNAKEPEKHVFHVVTDKLNFVSMRMWFLVNPPGGATIEVKNVDAFTWLNSSYCPVLRQLESARMRDYYFHAHQASSTTSGADNLKYRNPKYLSMLNHLRFYLPEVYPKLEKILFLDDDIVVQKDLTPLWSVDLKGMVNGAIETCKESFHRLDKYLNFSNPNIYENFDPNACGWAFGMNMFDLKEWRLRNITGIYHRWQDMNEDRTLWKLGTLPPGLITFYNLTYPLDRTWHVLGLGYDPALNQTAIQDAGVVHYNGNYKPWLDLAIDKYRSYWSKYVMFDNPYLKLCNIG